MLIALTYGAWRLGGPAVLTFWLAYILTRPFGAALGDLLTQAIRGLNVQDAAKILTGGETSVTEFFSSRTREPLSGQFLPVVSSATEKVKLTERYQKVAAKAASIGLLKKEDADLNQYVTAKTLDGLYFWIGEEEKKIRSDPVSAGSAVLRKV